MLGKMQFQLFYKLQCKFQIKKIIAHTLYLVPTPGLGDSTSPVEHIETAGLWEWLIILEANNCSNLQVHDEKSWMESECSRSLFFSKNPFVSYTTYSREPRC